MNKSHLWGAVCAFLFSFITVSAHAAFIGILPATPGSTDYRAFYDDQLGITWTADANINGKDTWDSQVTWATDLTLGGATEWRLPNMDVNGDNTIVNCLSETQAACMDNEYGHLYYYGAGTTKGGGIESTSPSPFSRVQAGDYWSGTVSGFSAWRFNFASGTQGELNKNLTQFAWAVHTGNISAIPIPASVWLFGCGLLGLVGMARRKKTA